MLRIMTSLAAFAIVFTWHAMAARGAEKEKFWHDYCREYVFNQNAWGWEKLKDTAIGKTV